MVINIQVFDPLSVQICKCGAQATYQERGAFICTECRQKIPVIPQKKRCMWCHQVYTEYTWFDPAVCPHCGTSFVD